MYHQAAQAQQGGETLRCSKQLPQHWHPQRQPIHQRLTQLQQQQRQHHARRGSKQQQYCESLHLMSLPLPDINAGCVRTQLLPSDAKKSRASCPYSCRYVLASEGACGGCVRSASCLPTHTSPQTTHQSRVSRAELVSEAMYALINLVGLYNDHILSTKDTAADADADGDAQPVVAASTATKGLTRFVA